MRVYLPLLPVPVLAVIVGFSACSRARDPAPEPHVIPALAPLPLPAPPAAPGAPAPADTPSEEEVRAFERPVPK